ncbi:MAG: hypothetical protein ABGY24_12720 [bacterium]
MVELNATTGGDEESDGEEALRIGNGHRRGKRHILTERRHMTVVPEPTPLNQ